MEYHFLLSEQDFSSFWEMCCFEESGYCTSLSHQHFSLRGLFLFLRTKNIKFLEKIPASKNFFKYDVLEQYAIFLIMFGFFVISCYRIF